MYPLISLDKVAILILIVLNGYIYYAIHIGANLLVDSTGLHLRIGDFGAAATMQSIDGTLDREFQGSFNVFITCCILV